MDRVRISGFRGVVHFPAAGRENMFIAFIPSSFDDLPWVWLVLFHCGIAYHTYVFMDIKMKQWPRFTARFRYDQIVEGKMLEVLTRCSAWNKRKIKSMGHTCGMIRSSLTYKRSSELVDLNSLNSETKLCFTSSKNFPMVKPFLISILFRWPEPSQ